MKQVAFEKLLELAKEFTARKERWHHHFLTKNCMYNAMGREFQLILENEEDGQSFVAVSFERPEKWLSEIEDLQMKNNR